MGQSIQEWTKFSTDFTWSILEYFVPYTASSLLSTCGCFSFNFKVLGSFLGVLIIQLVKYFGSFLFLVPSSRLHPSAPNLLSHCPGRNYFFTDSASITFLRPQFQGQLWKLCLLTKICSQVQFFSLPNLAKDFVEDYFQKFIKFMKKRYQTYYSNSLKKHQNLFFFFL